MKALGRNIIASLLCVSFFWHNQAQAWIAGNPSGRVTLVILFDYACPHCQATAKIIDELIQSETELRVLYRPVAVLGSDIAARAVLAAGQQQKSSALHQWTLLNRQNFTSSSVSKAAEQTNIDFKQLAQTMFSKGITDELKVNKDMLLATSSNAVPVILVGRSGEQQAAFKYQGEISKEQLKNIIDQLAR